MTLNLYTSVLLVLLLQLVKSLEVIEIKLPDHRNSFSKLATLKCDVNWLKGLILPFAGLMFGTSRKRQTSHHDLNAVHTLNCRQDPLQ